MVEKNEPSVRVEFESGGVTAPMISSTEPTQGTNPSAARDDRRVGLVVLLTVLLVAGLVALRPWEQSSSDATVAENDGGPESQQAGNPDVSESDPNDGGVPLVSTTTAPGASIAEDGSSNEPPRMPDLNSIARADLGFLGLEWGQTDKAAPRVYRTIDGETWTAVTTRRPIEEDAEPGTGRNYSNLTRTSIGYSMIEMVFGEWGGFGESDVESPRDFLVRRLVSENGVDWFVDETTPEIRTTAGPAFVWVNTDGPFIAFDPDRAVNSSLDELFDTWVTPAGGQEAPCWVERASEGRLQVYSCTGRPWDEPLSADMLGDPERFDGVVTCALMIVQRFEQPASLLIARPGDSEVERIGDVGTIGARPGTAVDGTLVLLDIGQEVDDTLFASCDGLIERPESRAPAMVVVPSDGSAVRRLPIPEEIELALQSIATSPQASVVVDDRLLHVLDGALWSANLVSGEWKKVVDLPSFFSTSSTAITDDGTRVIQIDTTNITVTDTATGEQLAEPHGLSIDYPDVRYVDSEVVYLVTRNSLERLAVPQFG